MSTTVETTEKSTNPTVTYKAKLLWHAGYWDGPMSGLAEYQSEKVWMNMFKDYDTEVCPEPFPGATELATKYYDRFDQEANEQFWDKLEGPDDGPNNFDDDFSFRHHDKSWHRHLPRAFKFYRVKPEVLEMIEKDHQAWRDTVGWHTEHDPELYMKEIHYTPNNIQGLCDKLPKYEIPWLEITKPENEICDANGAVIATSAEIEWFSPSRHNCKFPENLEKITIKC